MEDKYEKGGILKYDNGDTFLVCERLKKDEHQYILVMKLEGEIQQDKIEIDYNKMMIFKVLADDETIVEKDEKIIEDVFNEMLELEKLEFAGDNENNN